MEFRTPTPEECGLPSGPGPELPPGNNLQPEIIEVLKTPNMFELPNKQKLTNEELKSTAEALAGQYTIALQYEKTRTEIISEINDLLQADNKSGDWINKIGDMLEKAPQEAAPVLMRNLGNLPKGIREEFARLALEIAPKEAVRKLMEKLEYLPVEIRVEIARLALEKAPQEAAPELMGNLEYLPVEIQVEIARLALEKAPQEAAPGLMGNLEYLPEGIREEIEYEIMAILRTTEKSKLTESENINPILYKDIEDLEKQFSRKEFPKSGTRTVLLGGTLINNAILRIIPNHAFISWMKAYSAVEDWKKAGFDYVPIEPILKASSCKDGKDVRVYAGVLGVSVENYLQMYSNRDFHESVKKQVEAIRETLENMGIKHGHNDTNNNFCVLHERTPEGEIDWSQPPRVYCIDFDMSKSS